MPGERSGPIDTRIRPGGEPDGREPLDRDDVVNVYGEGHASVTTVSLAVSLLDDGERVTGPAVSIEGTDAEPTATPAGYLLFIDLDGSVPLDQPDDPVRVSVDGGDDYENESRSVIVTEDDPAVPDGVDLLRPRLPLVTIELTARPP